MDGDLDLAPKLLVALGKTKTHLGVGSLHGLLRLFAINMLKASRLS